MTRAKILQPDLILGDTILGLSLEILSQHQIKGLILDVDDTLVPLQETTVSDDLQRWVDSLRLYLPIWLVSNNLSENRIGAIADNLQLPYLLGAVKPSRRKLRQAMAAMSLPPPTNCYGWRSLVYRCFSGKSSGNVYHSGETNGKSLDGGGSLSNPRF